MNFLFFAQFSNFESIWGRKPICGIWPGWKKEDGMGALSSCLKILLLGGLLPRTFKKKLVRARSGSGFYLPIVRAWEIQFLNWALLDGFFRHFLIRHGTHALAPGGQLRGKPSPRRR